MPRDRDRDRDREPQPGESDRPRRRSSKASRSDKIKSDRAAFRSRLRDRKPPADRPRRGPLERVLIMGTPESGKTECWVSLAELALKLKPPSKSGPTFHVLDSDDRAEVQAEHLLDSNGGNVSVYVPADWPDWNGDLETALSRSSPGDWLIVDMISEPWDAVKHFYVEEVLGESLDVLQHEFARDNLAEGKRGGNILFEHGDPIGKLYLGWERRLRDGCKRHGLHLLACAPAKQLHTADSKTPWKDKQDVINICEPEGVKPEGHKLLLHRFNSIMLVEQKKRGQFRLTTMREASRLRRDRALWREPMENWAKTYALKVARIKF